MESKTDIHPLTQMICKQVTEVTQFVTIADKDNEVYYYDYKSKIWKENGENLIWKFVAQKYPTVKKNILNDVIHYIKGQTLKPREKFEPPHESIID